MCQDAWRKVSPVGYRLALRPVLAWSPPPLDRWARSRVRVSHVGKMGPRETLRYTVQLWGVTMGYRNQGGGLGEGKGPGNCPGPL